MQPPLAMLVLPESVVGELLPIRLWLVVQVVELSSSPHDNAVDAVVVDNDDADVDDSCLAKEDLAHGSSLFRTCQIEQIAVILLMAERSMVIAVGT